MLIIDIFPLKILKLAFGTFGSTLSLGSVPSIGVRIYPNPHLNIDRGTTVR